MVSQSQFAWVDRRSRQATGRTDEVFGGICVIMTGDPGQLPPVCGRALHAGHPKDQLSQEGFSAYRSFGHVIILTKVQRQLAVEDGDRAQKSFLELLPRARDGCLSEDDWRLLLTRAPYLQTEEEMDTFRNTIRLFYSKAEVKRYNGTKLRELGTSVLKVEASHSSASARKASAELAQGLHRDVFLVPRGKRQPQCQPVHRGRPAHTQRMVQLPEVHPRTVRPTERSPRAQNPDAKSRGIRDKVVRLRHVEPTRVPLQHAAPSSPQVLDSLHLLAKAQSRRPPDLLSGHSYQDGK